MRECLQTAEIRAVLAAEEHLEPYLASHAAGCRECTREIAAMRRFEQRLSTAMEEMVTNALPPETLRAAREGLSLGRMSLLPRLIASGVGAAAVLLFASIGVAATGVGMVETFSQLTVPPVDVATLEREFTQCYITETVAVDREGSRSTIAVEQCLADAARDSDRFDDGVVVVLNRQATATASCLQQRGWDVEPALEPGGRFLVPPVAPPAGGDVRQYQSDLERCSDAPL